MKKITLPLVMMPLIALGIFGNTHIIITTLLNNKLRGRTSILIAIAAFYDLVCFIFYFFVISYN